MNKGHSTPSAEESVFVCMLHYCVHYCVHVCVRVCVYATVLAQYIPSSYMSVRMQNSMPPPSMKMVAPQPRP